MINNITGGRGSQSVRGNSSPEDKGEKVPAVILGIESQLVTIK